MRSLLAFGIAAVLAATVVSDARKAAALEPSRLSALAARQAIRDQVCIAMANGYISRGDRYAILLHAKAVLKPEEYEGLKRAMDRLSPPQPAAAKMTAATAKVLRANAKTSPVIVSKTEPPAADGSVLTFDNSSAAPTRDAAADAQAPLETKDATVLSKREPPAAEGSITVSDNSSAEPTREPAAADDQASLETKDTAVLRIPGDALRPEPVAAMTTMR